MGLWSRLFNWITAVDEPSETPAAGPEADSNTVAFPTEPFVFECGSCGKVFESRRKRAQCPECDSNEVTVLS